MPHHNDLGGLRVSHVRESPVVWESVWNEHRWNTRSVIDGSLCPSCRLTYVIGGVLLVNDAVGAERDRYARLKASAEHHRERAVAERRSDREPGTRAHDIELSV